MSVESTHANAPGWKIGNANKNGGRILFRHSAMPFGSTFFFFFFFFFFFLLLLLLFSSSSSSSSLLLLLFFFLPFFFDFLDFLLFI
jgi:hypothetical protein